MGSVELEFPVRRSKFHDKFEDTCTKYAGIISKKSCQFVQAESDIQSLYLGMTKTRLFMSFFSPFGTTACGMLSSLGIPYNCTTECGCIKGTATSLYSGDHSRGS